jgi:hypothetical protein
MKYLGTIILVNFLLGFNAVAQQELSSAYFVRTQESKINNISEIPTLFHGRFHSILDSTRNIEIDANGASSFKYVLNFMPVELVNTSANYFIRNNYLFGIKRDDSLSCLVENDTCYYLVPIESTVFDANEYPVVLSENKMLVFKKAKENEFTVQLWEVENGVLSVASFDHEQCIDLVQSLSQKQHKDEYGILNYFIPINEQNVQKILDSKGFSDKNNYRL